MIACSYFSFLYRYCCSLSYFFRFFASFSSYILLSYSYLVRGLSLFFDILFIFQQYHHSYTMLKIFTRTLKYCNVLNQSVDTKSYQKLKIDLLRSQFHLHGRKHFLKSKYLTRDFDSNIAQIQKAMIDIEKRRSTVNEVLKDNFLNVKQQSIQKEEQRCYFQSYLKLTELVKQSKFDDYWFYSLVGWFNIQSMFMDLIQKLVNQTNKKGHLLLIDAVGWMSPNQYYLKKDLQFYQIQREHKNVDTYYSRLNLSLPFSVVKQIERIFDLTSTFNKSRFFDRYFNKNLSGILDRINVKNEEQIDDVFWILNIYIETMNDRKEVIEKIQNFILTKQFQIKEKHIVILMNVYNKKGSINRQIYAKFIRKYLVNQKKQDIQNAVKNLKFTIFSEADDLQMINFLLKLIAAAQQKRMVSRELKLQVHYLCHYMRIKQIKYQFSDKIQNFFCEQCTKCNQNGTIARTMAIEVDEKSRKLGSQIYQSDCLRKRRAIEQDSTQIGEQIKKGKGGDFKRYKNIKFCVLQIQNCVVNSKSKRAIILQTNYTRFEHSRRLIRQQQVRQDVLTHYGFKINYVESEMKRRIDPNEEQAPIEEEDSQDNH